MNKYLNDIGLSSVTHLTLIDLIPAGILLISVCKALWDFVLSERFSRSGEEESVKEKLITLRKKKKFDGTADQLAFFIIALLSATLIALQIEGSLTDEEELNELRHRLDLIETELKSNILGE